MISTRLPPFVRYPIIVYPTLLSLRDVAPDSMVMISLTSVGLLTLACAFALVDDRYRVQFAPATSVWFAIQGLGVVAALIAWLSGTIIVTSIVGNLVNIWAVVLVALVLAQYQPPMRETANLVLDALAVLVVTATVLYWLGVSPAVQRWEHIASASMLRSFGIYIHRAEFPLTKGVVSHATVCGLLLVGTLLRKTNIVKKSAIVIMSIYGILMADGRAALLFSLLILAYAWVGRFRGFQFIPWAGLLGAPFFLVVARIVPSDWLVFLSRSGNSTELLSGSNRLQIWSTGLSYMTDHWLHALIGAGAFGQAAAGIFDYRFFLGFSRNFLGSSESLSMHNATMQVWFDSGLLGIAILAVLLFVVAREIVSKLLAPGGNTVAVMFSFVIMNSIFTTYGLTVYWDEGYFATMLVAFAPLAEYGGVGRGRDYKVSRASGTVRVDRGRAV